MGLSNRVDRVTDMIEELIDREEQYDAFLAASPWGILVVDITFHIVYANKRLLDMTGYSFRELIGQHLHMIMPKEDRKMHVKHEKEYIKQPHHRTGNHGLRPRVLRKDGTVFDVEISISPTVVRGRKMFFASVRELDTLFHTVEGKVKGT